MKPPLSFLLQLGVTEVILVNWVEGGSDMDELGRRLRGFRLENGWSKRAIAERLGVSIPSIIRWEEGASAPNDYNRYKIDRLLDGFQPSPRHLARRSMIQLSLFPERIPSSLSQP
jgi:transcriptional regulator with XRE-family HTH domain